MNRKIPMRVIQIFFLIFGLAFVQSIANRYLAVSDITPDFFLMTLLWISFRVKIEKATWIGFSLGLIQDAIAGSAVFGLSSLVKTFTGYMIGTAKLKYPFAKNLTLAILHISAIWIHFLLYYWFYHRGIDLSVLNTLGYSLVATIYTGSIFLLLDFVIVNRFGLLK